MSTVDIDPNWSNPRLDQDLSVPDDLIDPFTVDQQWCDNYREKLSTRSRQDIVDDLCMLYLVIPWEGYGDRRPMLSALRLDMITEIQTRPNERGKLRLEYRLKLRKDTVDAE